MDELRPIWLHVRLLEFENALSAICVIFKTEKKFAKTEISEILDVYFHIPRDLKINQREKLKPVLQSFLKFQASELNAEQKKNILHEFQNLRHHDIWYTQEYIEVCISLGEIENAREKFYSIIDEAFAYRRLGLIESVSKRFNDLIDQDEKYQIDIRCACIRHDKFFLEQMYKLSLSNNEKRHIFMQAMEIFNHEPMLMPEGLEISMLKQQLSNKILPKGRKKVVNKLYEYLAKSTDKRDILILCAEYFLKVKRKTVAQNVVDLAKALSDESCNFEPVLKELEEKLKKEKEDKVFSLENDETFDLAEDLLSSDIRDIYKTKKKPAHNLDMSLMSKEAFLIRQGVISLDEITNQELKQCPINYTEQDRKLEKDIGKAIRNIDMALKIEIHKDLVSALIMFEMLDPALSLCEELMPVLEGIESRISIHYLLSVINFKKENYERVIKLCDGAISSLPLSSSDKVAFLRIMAASFQKKGEFKNSISVNKLIKKLISASNEVQD